MKSSFTLIVVLLFTFNVTAQVGIGTAMPDPSSVLDISSTSQGLLAPRMSSVQRAAIVSPANGLLVFDTTDNSFYFFEGGSWKRLSSSKSRTKYKLVQSVTDLTQELAAGGGSTYLLSTDFLYEINGTIIFDFPINLNGAYVEGVDALEDILVNNSAGSLFQGNKGGGLRNLTLSGNGKQLFNISATASDLLLVTNTVIAGSSSVGTLSGLGTVFLSVNQYVSNATGLTASNIENFFVSNAFWTASNTGTFLSLTGNFKNLQINGGRLESDAGEIGIDVSANPTIVSNASLAQLSFVGAGLYVKPYTTNTYTGFNFTKDWDVNCPGIPVETDQTAAANIYYNGTLTTGFVQRISDSTPVQINSATNFVASGLFRFKAEDNNNDLVYDGKRRRNVNVNVSLSIRVTSATGDFYGFAIAKNGSILTETNSVVIITGDAQVQNVALNGVVSVMPGDRIEIFTTRLTGNGPDDLVVFSENVSIR